jgi:hypothetical protein
MIPVSGEEVPWQMLESMEAVAALLPRHEHDDSFAGSEKGVSGEVSGRKIGVAVELHVVAHASLSISGRKRGCQMQQRAATGVFCTEYFLSFPQRANHRSVDRSSQHAPFFAFAGMSGIFRESRGAYRKKRFEMTRSILSVQTWPLFSLLLHAWLISLIGGSDSRRPITHNLEYGAVQIPRVVEVMDRANIRR